MSDEPVHKAGSLLVEKLPERIAVPQDVEDIFAAFEAAANAYVAARVPGGDFSQARSFVSPSSNRLIRDRDVEELHRLLQSNRRDTIPMRHALNAIGSFVKAIEAARHALKLEPVDCPRDNMSFYYELDEKIRALQAKIHDQFVLIGEQQMALEKRKVTP